MNTKSMHSFVDLCVASWIMWLIGGEGETSPPARKGHLTMGRRLAVMLFASLLPLLLSGTAEAHANLVRSDPPAGALLQVAPKALVLEFSEELDPSFSRVQLHNSKNQIVNPGPGVIDPASPLIMRLELGDLPK